MISEQVSREKPYSFYNLVKQESTNSKALDSSTSYSTLDSLSEKLPKSQTFYRFIDGSIVPFTLTISEDNLVISGKNDYTFSYDDILGATVKQVDFSKADKIPELWKKKKELYQLRIYFLLKNQQDDQKNSQYLEREYQKVKFYIENKTLAMQWKNLILHAANNPDFLNIWKSNGLEDLPPFKRHLLVFINPRSGNQKGNKVWSRAKKLLFKAGCEFVEVFTKEPGFAREYIKQYNSSQLKEIDGFVTVSGDGLLHEIINGLYQRPDWEDFSDIPFGIIPSGTSNSLIRNLVERKKDVANTENACLIIAKGKKFKADLTSLERHDGSKIFSFLIFAWSTMAEIDVGSNHLRALGKFRFTVNGIWNILLLKEYRAKVAFSTNNAEIPSIHEEIQVGQGWEIIHDNFGHFSLHNVSWIETNYQVVPHADLQDGHNHLLTLKGDGVSRVRVGSALAKFKGQLFNGDKPHESLKVGYEKIKAFRIEPLDDKPSYYDIDGEPYNATKIQGRVLEKTLTLYGS